VKKLVYLVGVIMLGAVAAAIYYDDLIIRVIAGAVFIVGAVFVYYNLGGAMDDAEPGEDGLEDRGAENPVSRSKPSDPTGERTYDGVSGGSSRGNDAPRHTRPQRFQASSEIPEELYKTDPGPATDGDPRMEFDLVTRRLLAILKDHLLAHTVALFWINHDRGQIVFGEFVTDSSSYTSVRRAQLGADLVSLIGKSGKPQVLSDISSGSVTDMLPYYDNREPIQSFIGVPMFFDGEPIAVLTADSTAADSFGVETVAIMGKVTVLISQVLSSFTQKFDLATDARLYAVTQALQRDIAAHFDAYGIAASIARAVTSVLDWDFLAVVMQQAQTKNWIIVHSRTKAPNLAYVSEGVTAEIDGSIFRPVLDALEPRILDAPRTPEYRFYMKEAIASSGQICVVPFAFQTATPAMLVVEYREQKQYGRRDLETASFLCELGTLSLEVFQLREVSRKNLLYEEHLEVGSRAFFMQRLSEEYYRGKVSGEQSVFLSVAFDGIDSLLQKYGDDGLDVALASLAKLLRGGLLPFDVIGLLDRARFGLLLIRTSAEDAYLRGEKLRKSVAAHVVVYSGMSFSVTVSIAGCTFSSAMQIDDILSICQQAMDRAIADGGNCVKVV
jgi:GGDEF domain-containing protein/putative methionine-R-sulfoxide reductase with GAF domain